MRLARLDADPRSLSRPYVDRKAVATVVQAHLKGNRNYTNEIHKLLSLEILHRLFLDRSGARDNTVRTCTNVQ